MDPQPTPTDLIPIKVGVKTILISPDRDPEYIRSLYMIFHQPVWGKS
jgi:hypothetical protein